MRGEGGESEEGGQEDLAPLVPGCIRLIRCTAPPYCPFHTNIMLPHHHACRYDVRYSAVVVGSLARLGHVDAELVDAVLGHATRRVGEAYTREMAAVCKVWGCVRREEGARMGAGS